MGKKKLTPKEIKVRDDQFQKWYTAAEELLGALSETAGTDDFLRHALCGLMLRSVMKLSVKQPTVH